MKKVAFFLILTIAIASCNNKTKTEGNTDEIKTDTIQTAALYQCPMDCEKGKTYEQAGKCPVCEMDLEKK